MRTSGRVTVEYLLLPPPTHEVTAVDITIGGDIHGRNYQHGYASIDRKCSNPSEACSK